MRASNLLYSSRFGCSSKTRSDHSAWRVEGAVYVVIGATNGAVPRPGYRTRQIHKLEKNSVRCLRNEWPSALYSI